MSEALQRATRLARKERSQRRGRRGYSDELRTLIRTAAKSHSKAELSKSTGISYPTLHRIIGTTRKARAAKGRRTAAGKKSSRRPRAGKESAPSARRTQALSIEVAVELPSGARLTYSDLKTLRDDAKALGEAARQLG